MTRIEITLHDVAAPERLERVMAEQARELAASSPALLACRLGAQGLPGADGKGPMVQVHVELVLREHQIILNRVGATADDALRDALAAAGDAIERLAARDPGVAAGLPCASRGRLPMAA